MANQQIEDIICDAVNILVDAKIDGLEFDKTIQATILSCVDEATGRYKVKYQNSTFTAFSQDLDTEYRTSQMVYILVPQGDFNNTKTILGTVDKLGTEYVKIVDKEKRINKLTENVIKYTDEPNFCSYRGTQSKELLNMISLDKTEIQAAKDGADALVLAGTFRTSLSDEQKRGQGDYGIVVTAKFYNSAYKTTEGQTESDLIIRQYILDTKQMSGQPYNFSTASRQYYIFPFDGENLKEITSVAVYCKDFPKYDTSISTPDIYIKNLEMYLGKQLSDEDFNGTFMTISTPYGSYYDSSNLNSQKVLQVNLRNEGKNVSNDDIKEVYWFVKDNSINIESEFYNDYGGIGWKCLNDKVTYKDGFIEWAAAGYRYTLSSSVCSSKETMFKAVVVYNGSTVTAQTTFTNYTASVITIESSAGTSFNFDFGETTLTAQVNNTTRNDYSYIWTVSIDDASPVSIQTLSPRLSGVQIKQALNKLVYDVTVQTTSGITIGSASITLVNSHTVGQYNLVLHNGSRIFKYNGRGVSPTSNSTDPKDRISLDPLTFDVYDANGKELALTDDVKVRMCDIVWKMPSSDTMLTWNYSGTELKNSPQFIYGLANSYDINKSNNEIILEVTYKGLKMTASTNFTFTKEGELGTNGTEYTARIVPYNSRYEKVFMNYRNGGYHIYGTYYDSSDNLRVVEIGTPHLKAELYSGNADYDYSGTDVNWSLMTLIDEENSSVINQTPNITIANGRITGQGIRAQSTVIRSEFTSNKYSQLARSYFGFYPLQVGFTNNIMFVDGGYESVEYGPDGTRPTYVKRPFRLRVFNASGVEMSVTPSSVSWSNSWDGRVSEGGTGQNSYLPVPDNKYDNGNTNRYVTCTYQGYRVYISIHHYLNQYSMTNVNGWDGNSIEINNNKNYILAPQIAAGEKNSSNQFTGVVMGKTMQDKNTTENGIFAYNKGNRTVFIDAEDGSATFGESGKGQIIIDPSTSKAIIKSGNYSTGSSGQGMQIDLSTPEIRFGNGKFRVSSEGILHAEEGEFEGNIEADSGTIGGWTLTKSRYDDISQRWTKSIYAGSTYLNASGTIKVGSKFQVDSSGNLIAHDATLHNVTATSGSFSGKISASSGSIGNWNINNSRLEYIKSGEMSASIYISPFYLHYTDNFEVNSNGVLTAKSGKIGPWQISDTSIYKGTNNINSATAYLGDNGIGISAGAFKVDSSGNITITKGSININSGTFKVETNGNITATSGTIGGWSILTSRLESTYGGKRSGMQKHLGDNYSAFYAGCTTPAGDTIVGNSAFYVTHAGKLYSNNAEITGVIKANSLSIKDTYRNEYYNVIKISKSEQYPIIIGNDEWCRFPNYTRFTAGISTLDIKCDDDITCKSLKVNGHSVLTSLPNHKHSVTINGKSYDTGNPK